MNPSTENPPPYDVEEPAPDERAAFDAAPDEMPDEGYRVVCATAVAALAIGALSPLAVVDPFFLALPVFGVFLAWRAIRKIRASTGEYLGIGAAYLGLLLSIGSFVGGMGWHSYVYATELHAGESRLYFEELQPDPTITGQAIPPSALQLDGKQVLVKGYMMPGSQTAGINEFLLVRDKGECCFGGKPRITDRIDVRLNNRAGTDYRYAVKVAGTLHVDASKSQGVYYYLEEAEVR